MTQRSDPGPVPAEKAAQTRGRAANALLWALQIALALFFAAASAFPKLTAHPSATEVFDRIGHGDWFMYLVGVLELAGAVGLLIPLLSGAAALALAGLMAGAFVYQVAFLDAEHWFTPVILLGVFAFLAWARRDRTAELLSRIAGRG